MQLQDVYVLWRRLRSGILNLTRPCLFLDPDRVDEKAFRSGGCQDALEICRCPCGGLGIGEAKRLLQASGQFSRVFEEFLWTMVPISEVEVESLDPCMSDSWW